MHRLVIAVAAVFLIATSTATGQNTKIDYGSSSDKILAEGKILHVQSKHLDQRLRFVVAYRGHIFNCFNFWKEFVECISPLSLPAKILWKDKKK